MVREKMIAKRSLEATPSPQPVDQNAVGFRKMILEADITQLVDLKNPEMSDLTAKFGPGTKLHKFVYPGKGRAHIGHAPANPPLRSELYREFPELIGKRYTVTAQELERLVHVITRRWKKVLAYQPTLTLLVGDQECGELEARPPHACLPRHGRAPRCRG